jgi:hypothetical protein
MSEPVNTKQMKKIIFQIIILIVVSFTHINGQTTSFESGLGTITTDVLKGQLGFLASDWTEGRASGEKGGYLAGDFIASMLQLYGIKPAGDFPQPRGFSNFQRNAERTYFQNFILRKTSFEEDPVLEMRSESAEGVVKTPLTFNIDFSVRPSGIGTEIDAPVVFAGYGFKNEKLKWNDYGKLDVKGKFVVKIAGVPGIARGKLSPGEISESGRETEKYLRSAGALGIIEINANEMTVGTFPGNPDINLSPSESNPRPWRPYTDYILPEDMSFNDFPRIMVSRKVGEQLLESSGISLSDFLQKSEGSSNVPIPVITGKNVYFKTDIKASPVKVRNIIGIIEGNKPDQVIVLGAHYDHLGEANGYIWNGADDNASGTVGVMTIARAIMASGKKPDKTIIIALWTAEELGLLGSEYYVNNLAFPVKNLRLNVNFDMISRYIADNEPNKVIMTYSESCPEFRNITESNIKKLGIDLNVDYQPSKDPPGGSDHRSFVAAGIPVMRFKPGHREEYHTPADEVSTVDWDIMEKIVKISYANVWELANSNW